MSSSAGEKTEDPTPKKRADAAKEGDLLRSRDLTGAAMFAALLGWVLAVGGVAIRDGMNLLRDGLAIDRQSIVDFQPGRATQDLLMHFSGSLGMLVVLMIIAILLSGAALGSISFRWSSANIKWSRINPGEGFKRMFGGEALIGLATSLVKVSAVVVATGWLLSGDRLGLMQLAHLGPWAGATALARILLQALMTLTMLMAVAAIVDVFIQWRRREGRLMMSKQDVRDEHKEAEGAPERKRALRERQYAIATRSARKAMTEATVVLNNPTHFAVALRYRPEIDAVPMVVARGSDEVARAIRDLAVENNVPQLEYPLLARAIYFTAKVNQPISDELYLAVATVLAFVFNLEASLAAGRVAPVVDVPKTMRFDGEGRPTN